MRRLLGAGRVADGPIAAVSGRDRTVIVCCILAIAAMAWGYLLYLDWQMSSALEDASMARAMGMPTAMPGAANILFLFGMWSVMMVAMMAGAVTPVVLLFAAVHAQRSGRRLPWLALAFGLGYAIVWIGFSACAALAQWVLHQSAALSPVMAATGSLAAGLVLCAIGIYQLTPLKAACLAHCRSPLGFLMTHWRDGIVGALRMGLWHGAYCVGCCWALMMALFVVGVMNLLWVAALMLLVLIEKVGPAGNVVSRIAGAAMIGAGVFLLASAAATTSATMVP
ncbi:MAG: DUF2182 domain-containing protein [Casimicrobiaceae bacterium]